MKRAIWAPVALVVVVLATVGLARLKPAAPTVERSSVWTDTVKRGSMLRQVRGLGSLVPEEIMWIPAVTEGRVDRVIIQPGTPVKADAVILVLSNPELEQQATDAIWRLRAAEAAYKNAQVQLQSAILNQKAEAARIGAEANEARMRAETDQELSKLGVISGLSLKVSTGRAQELSTRSGIEEQRLANSQEALKSQLAAERANVEQFRAMAQLRTQQLEALKVKAGTDGVLQDLPVRPGQWVTAGTMLARVVQPTRLKAELRVPETQAKDVQLGLPATIDTRNGIVEGRVSRIDPSVQNGTVTVDVQILSALPEGARPDLSVDGTITLQKLENVLYVGRPAFGQENSTVGMFKLEPQDNEANRVQIKLGRASVNTVEIQQGLKEGDTVILSDMSRWDNYDRVKLQ